MNPFTVVDSVAASIRKDNIDTDMILPVRFMKTVSKLGLKDGLFAELRQQKSSNSPPFVLNRAPFSTAQILIVGNNFGCGSSREHAPWALKDFGIKVILAGSFADIFFNNCFKNGLLPIVLPSMPLQKVRQVAEAGERIKIDLERQLIDAAGEIFSFPINTYHKKYLLEGQDDITSTLMREEKITIFEQQHRALMPWLFGRGTRVHNEIA